MKTISHKFIVVVMMLATAQMLKGQQQHIIMNSPPAPGVYEAGESITLQPGFSFTATQNNSLTLKISDPCNTGDPAQDFTCKMNRIFQYVDRNTVTSGLLKDYGLELIDVSAYNGVPADTNYATMDAWRMLYSSIFSSRFGNNATLTAPDIVFDNFDNASANSVAMMHFNYQTLNETAFTITNDQIHLVAGHPLPYVNKTLFAVAPKQLYFNTNAASFVFNSNLWYSNVSKTIQKREINFDNESGYLLAN